jgi:pimeloyl-ACP methyl ester carboxylesterase
MGRRMPLHSWGYRGQITDLSKMPEIARRTLPWLKIDRRRIYALGSSMGGQETLLLLGQHPQLLAGAIAMDSVTNFYRRYGDFAITPRRAGLQMLARFEVGGTPQSNPTGYVLRSPTHWLKEIAGSGVPLQICGASPTRSSSTRPTSPPTSTPSSASSGRAGESRR